MVVMSLSFTSSFICWIVANEEGLAQQHGAWALHLICLHGMRDARAACVDARAMPISKFESPCRDHGL